MERPLRHNVKACGKFAPFRVGSVTGIISVRNFTLMGMKANQSENSHLFVFEFSSAFQQHGNHCLLGPEQVSE